MTALAAREWRRNQIAITAAAFIGFTGFTLVMPFLPLYFEQLGVESPGRIAIWSGLSLGVTPAVTAAMAPVWARVADRVGRKPMVGRSLISFVVIFSALAFVTAPWQVLALRAVQGFFAGYVPIVLTMVAESAPPGQTASAIGWMQTAQRIGPATGPVIGGVLAQAVGLRNAFLVAAAFYAMAFVLVAVAYREAGRPPGPSKEARRAITFATFRRMPNFVLFMTVIFGLQLVDRSFGPILPLFLLEIGAPVARVPFLSGAIFTIVAASAALGNQTCAWWLQRVRAARLVPVAMVVASAPAVVFGLGPPTPVLFGLAAAFGLGLGLATTAVYTAASAAVPAETRGLAFGYLTTAYLVAVALSPVLAGLIGSLSMRAVFVLDAIGLFGLAAFVGYKMTRVPAGQLA